MASTFHLRNCQIVKLEIINRQSTVPVKHLKSFCEYIKFKMHEHISQYIPQNTIKFYVFVLECQTGMYSSVGTLTFLPHTYLTQKKHESYSLLLLLLQDLQR